MNEEKSNEKEKIEIEDQEENNEFKKMGFFKKVWHSIANIEKYPNMAAEGVGRALSYMMKIVACLAIVIALGTTYQAFGLIKEGINYLENEFPEFSYQDGTLDINSDEIITIEGDNSVVGKTIIDTKTEDEQQINSYINSLEEYGEGIVILKNKVIIKTSAVARNDKL